MAFDWADFERAVKKAKKRLNTSEAKRFIGALETMIDRYSMVANLLGYGDLVTQMRKWIAEIDKALDLTKDQKHEKIRNKAINLLRRLGIPMKQIDKSMIDTIIKLIVNIQPRNIEKLADATQ